jgi:hypothetical protein
MEAHMDSKQNSQKKCSICHSKPYLDAQKLCPACEEYANQDYVSDTEEVLESTTFDKYICDITGKIKDSPWSGSGDSTSQLNQVIDSADLTQAERKALALYHIDGKGVSEIALNLRLAHGTIKSLLARGIRKLREVDLGKVNFHHAKHLDLLDPYEFYSCCPRCKSLELEASSDCEGECSQCGWEFNLLNEQ